ncbi:MAG TPA: GspH/FimT family pseudopilin [Thermoanaerobaculia bacterium]|jgi:type II secretory pathway pseudopilin PulG
MQRRTFCGRTIRGRWIHGPGAGYTLLDALMVVAILGFVAATIYPPFVQTTSSLRLKMAAQQIAGAMRLARAYAIRHSANVAVKFRVGDDGAVTYALYRDGDGDGVRSNDLESGKDPEVWPPRRLHYIGGSVRVGIPPGRPPRHPGNPDRRLDQLDDPIKFNSSDLASFSPLGTATPGSIYLSDAHRHLMAVRIYHVSGKVTILAYDETSETWQ